ncbi:hypothetical protein GX411_09455 [Candidatus Fermentibacteria bacterium]|nr:hypothetical protein [Candidatus Fermentibacteria bacterium]
MEPVKSGTVLYCGKCGVEVTVTKDCGSADCSIACCGEPMKRKGGGCCCCGG